MHTKNSGIDEKKTRAQEKKVGHGKFVEAHIKNDQEKILNIIKILKKNPDIQEIMISGDSIRVVQFPPAGYHTVTNAPVVSHSPQERGGSPAPKKEEVIAVTGREVLSPMVGTAYMASKPGDSPFVKVGDMVQKDQVVMIIEAMKLMNPIKSPIAGRVSKICVENAVPVEYEEVLLYIDPL